MSCHLRWFVMAAAVSVAFLTGCASYDYVGRRFAELPEDASIVYYNDRADVPAGKYAVMGRMTVTAPDDFDSYDVKDGLLEKARDYGADAVCVISIRHIKVGTYEISNDGFSGPADPYNPANLNADGSPIQVDSFGREVKLGGETRFRYEVKAEAIFLKDKETLKRLLAARGGDVELEEIEKSAMPKVKTPEQPREKSVPLDEQQNDPRFSESMVDTTNSMIDAL